jgi:hypothetical protein
VYPQESAFGVESLGGFPDHEFQNLIHAHAGMDDQTYILECLVAALDVGRTVHKHACLDF